MTRGRPARAAGGLVLLLLLLVAPPLRARDSLGIFERWGAFRDARPERCYAIAEPDRPGSPGADWRPFASVAFWPRLGQRNQLHLRLSRARLPNAPVQLVIGERRFELLGGIADAWAPHPRVDAAIVAAMRSADTMTVTSRAANGPIRDRYRLRGAASAIDAAALGCSRR